MTSIFRTSPNGAKRARFAPFGDVRNIEVIRDTAFGGEQCRGFAYVELAAAEAEVDARTGSLR